VTPRRAGFFFFFLGRPVPVRPEPKPRPSLPPTAGKRENVTPKNSLPVFPTPSRRLHARQIRQNFPSPILLSCHRLSYVIHGSPPSRFFPLSPSPWRRPGGLHPYPPFPSLPPQATNEEKKGSTNPWPFRAFFLFFFPLQPKRLGAKPGTCAVVLSSFFLPFFFFSTITINVTAPGDGGNPHHPPPLSQPKPNKTDVGSVTTSSFFPSLPPSFSPATNGGPHNSDDKTTSLPLFFFSPYGRHRGEDRKRKKDLGRFSSLSPLFFPRATVNR